MYSNVAANREGDDLAADMESGSTSTPALADPYDDVTQSFVRPSNLPTYPLDRLSRCEATLWRQARQIVFSLQRLDRRKPWERPRLR
jgi:hypothetical protein